MKGQKFQLKKYGVWLVIISLIIISVQGCAKKVNKKSSEPVDKLEKGYDLPINESEKAEARQDGLVMMEKVRTLYKSSEKEEGKNALIAEQTIRDMIDLLEKTGVPVVYDNKYAEMQNYQKVDNFLINAQNGEKGEIILYEIHRDGSLERNKFTFDGINMFLLNTIFSWSKEDEPVSSESVCTRMKSWKYTEKGWFCYEYCVPEPPEVTERIDGNRMLRVKPLDERYREISEKYLLPLAYKGNNLLCSDWDKDHMEAIDYNGLFESFYMIENQERLDSEKYTGGIPEDEFEAMMITYLPISAEQLQKYAVYDAQSQTYGWNRLGCMNYSPTTFGLSIPEVTDMKENEDGTILLFIDAVCERAGDDCVMSHELLIKFQDGEIRYLGNQVLKDGLETLPKYQYRME